MATQIYVNLPVKNLEESVEFFTALGFSFNPDYTDENATCMIINDDAFVMLLVEGFFKTFTSKDIADSTGSTEAIMAFSVDSREGVDDMFRKALAAGGTRPRRSRTTASCTATASRTPTATCGRSCGWTPRARPPTPA